MSTADDTGAAAIDAPSLVASLRRENDRLRGRIDALEREAHALRERCEGQRAVSAGTRGRSDL